MDSFDEDGVYTLARAFFQAVTKASGDSEDILPQEVTAPRLPRPCGQLLELTSELPRAAQDGEESKPEEQCVPRDVRPHDKDNH